MFHVKHSDGQSGGFEKRKTTLVIAILAIVAVLLGIVLVVTQPTAETETIQHSTTTKTTIPSASSSASGNTTSSGITSEKAQDIESENTDFQIEDQPVNKVDYSGYEYEPGVVLATPLEGASVEEVADAIDIDPSNVVRSEAGFLEITLPEGMTVEEAVETLQASEVVEGAQPNFIYELQEEGEALEDELVQEEQEAEDEDVEEEPAPTSDETPESATFEESSDASETIIEDTPSPAEETGLVEASESVSEEPQIEQEDAAIDSSSDEEPIEEFTEQADGNESTSSSVEETEETPKTNDPRVSEQWALESIHAFEAWELLKEHQAQRVSVAVIDEGFELDHEDLKGNLIKTDGGPYATYNAVDGSSDVSEMKYGGGHGTHVAGIIAAEANNGIGVAGASYNQNIIPIKAFYLNSNDEPRTNTLYVTTAYSYIMEHQKEYNIRVINISFGIFGQRKAPDADLEKAIAKAREAGIVTVASAGNGDKDDSVPTDNYPSDSEQVVAVINLCENQPTAENPDVVKRYSTSNYNIVFQDGTFESCKNIAAPGTDILSTSASKSYVVKKGTSMAAPYVSSVFAMMFAVYPRLSADDAISTLYATAFDLGPKGFDAETGYGEVNAFAAVNAAVEAIPDEPVSPIDSTSSTSSSSKTPVKPAKWTAGATKMPVGATSIWKLKNCTLKVVSGSDVVSIAKDGRTVKAKGIGRAKLAVVNSAGKRVASSTIRVYKLAGKHAVCNVGKGEAKLAVSKNSKKAGAKVVLTKNGKVKSTKVKVVYRNGYYQFLFTHSSKPLKIKASSKKQYAPAVQGASPKNKATQWKVTVDSNNRLTFINRNSGKVLAAKGKTVVQRKPTGTSTEKWLVN